MYEETTIAAIATAPGEGGIGIVRISGSQAADVADALFHTKKIKSFHEAEPYRLYFGHVVRKDQRVDEGLAVYMKAPHSYTGEDVVEIQIHGSTEASGRHWSWLWKTVPSLPAAANLPKGPSSTVGWTSPRQKR